MRWRSTATASSAGSAPPMPGICSMSACPPPSAPRRVADQLLSSAFNSGWGVRTLAEDEVPFNPMSYHNGSIWPHDTAICAAGLARYDERDSVVQLMSGTFEAAVHFNMRLPELFCGFTRAPGEAPVAYPVACLPQAWSAGAVFMLMQACLGLTIDGWNGEIIVTRPRLPIGIDNLSLRHLARRRGEVDIVFERVGDRVVCLSRIAATKGWCRCRAILIRSAIRMELHPRCMQLRPELACVERLGHSAQRNAVTVGGTGILHDANNRSVPHSACWTDCPSFAISLPQWCSRCDGAKQSAVPARRLQRTARICTSRQERPPVDDPLVMDARHAAADPGSRSCPTPR